MKKALRFLFRTFLIILLIVIGIVVIKTISYSSRQVDVSAIQKTSVNNDAIDRLSKAVQFTTVSYPDRIDTSAFSALLQFISQSYPLSDSLLDPYTVNGYSLVYHWPGKNRKLDPILLIGHMDVVPVEIESQKEWTHPPYSGKIVDDYIWGRGTLDDKVSVLGLLEAVELLLKNNYRPERSIYLAFGHDEEVSGLQGAKSIARRFKQQGIHFEYVLDEGGIVLEDALPGLSKPLALIGNSEKGYTTLSLTAQLEEGGHSSMPPAETAIGILSMALAKLQDNPFPGKISGPVKTLFDYTGPEMDMPLKAVFANLWLFEGVIVNQLSQAPASSAMMRTTIAPTILESGVKENVLPTTAKAKINFRIYPRETPASVAEYIKTVIADDRIKVEENNPQTSQSPSKISSIESFGFNVLRKTTREIFEEVVVTPSLVIAATDSRHYGEVADDIYRLLPVRLTNDDLKRIHGIDECISIDNYKKVIQFYHQLILNSSK